MCPKEINTLYYQGVHNYLDTLFMLFKEKINQTLRQMVRRSKCKDVMKKYVENDI